MQVDKMIVLIALVLAIGIVLIGKDSGCCGSGEKDTGCKHSTTCNNDHGSEHDSCCSPQEEVSFLVNGATNSVKKLVDQIQEQGLPLMLELGSDTCIPCKMMEPIIAELRQEYSGKMVVKFIDVWKNPEQAEKYNIKIIPTQIFFDSDGKEIYRNEGFFSKEDILKTWAEHNIIF